MRRQTAPCYSSPVPFRRPDMRARNSILAVALLLTAGCGGCGYNRVVQEEQAVDKAWSDVETQLQRRADLIPNLVEVVKGYASHEKEVFANIAQSRAAMLGASTRADKINAANQFESAVGRLFAIAENYPQLKADANFARLMDELSGTENRLAVAR